MSSRIGFFDLHFYGYLTAILSIEASRSHKPVKQRPAMMKHFSFGFRYFDGLFLLTFPFVEVVLAQSAGLEAFTFPASGSKASYNSLDSLNVTWEANNFTNPYLMLWVGTPQELGTLPFLPRFTLPPIPLLQTLRRYL